MQKYDELKNKNKTIHIILFYYKLATVHLLKPISVMLKAFTSVVYGPLAYFKSILLESSSLMFGILPNFLFSTGKG